MNFFEYMEKMFKKVINELLVELPLLSLDMDEESWEELLKEEEDG